MEVGHIIGWNAPASGCLKLRCARPTVENKAIALTLSLLKIFVAYLPRLSGLTFHE